MDACRQVAANSIETSAGGLAALTVERMTDRAAGAAVPFTLWKESLTARLQELVVALREEDPELFARQVSWARTACETRAVPLEQLHLSLDCLREVLAEELDPAAVSWVTSFLELAQGRLRGPDAAAPSLLDASTVEGRLVAEYLRAILEGERRRAAELVVQAVRAGTLTAQDAYLKVLLPAQEEIGRMWLMNEAGVADEHFVTATTKLAMARMTASVPAPAQNGKTVVTAAVAGNAHDVAVQALADLFELDGWRVVQLGADVPPEEVAEAVRHHHGDLVALSVTLPTHRATALRTIQALQQMEPRPRILIGGGALGRQDAWMAHGADTTAGTIEEGLARARALVGLQDEPEPAGD